eukprot:398506_1
MVISILLCIPYVVQRFFDFDGLLCLDSSSGSLASLDERCQGVERYCFENDIEYKLVYTDTSNADGSQQAIESAIDDFESDGITLRVSLQRMTHHVWLQPMSSEIN